LKFHFLKRLSNIFCKNLVFRLFSCWLWAQEIYNKLNKCSDFLQLNFNHLKKSYFYWKINDRENECLKKEIRWSSCFSACLAVFFSHVSNKASSFFIVFYQLHSGKHHYFDQDVIDWLLCGYKSIFLSSKFIGGNSFLFPSMLQTFYWFI
jgi:hypothetical protein